MRRAFLVLLALLPACGEAVRGLEVVSAANAFSLSATLEGATGEESRAWRTSGAQAWVAWEGTALESGTVNVVVTDAAGGEVYREQAGPGVLPAAGATASSDPGEWEVRVRWTDATGPLAVRITAVTGTP